MNQNTRDRLISAARRIFADKGFDAASVREITRAANANLGAITYHFGSKQGLYDAVIEGTFGAVTQRLGLSMAAAPTAEAARGAGQRRAQRTRAAQPGNGGAPARSTPAGGRATAPAALPAEPLARIQAIVAVVFAHIAANTDLPLLVLQQAVSRGALPEPAQRGLGALLGALSEAVRAGQAQGTIRAGDPRLMALSAMAQPVYFTLVRRLAPDRLLGGGRAMPTPEVMARHAIEFLRCGLSSGGEGDR